ncbi:MAG: hypothetical protein ABJF04_15100 [Reichenbachiella sp.]|uniref:hypothetical protein n=1 Tax=Reichenbachiella sp. TaxID=2184521 RepID=UPI0032642922
MNRFTLSLLLITLSISSFAQSNKDQSGPQVHLIKKNLWVDGNISSAGEKDLVLQTNQSTRITVLDANGYVGMGITNPQEQLHMGGAIRGNATGGALRVNTEFGWLDLGAQNGQSVHIHTNLSKFVMNKELRVDGAIGTYGNRNLELRTNGHTQMTILDSNGFVGIGITNPSERLEVAGSIKASETITGKDLMSGTLTTTDGSFTGNVQIEQNLNVNGLVGLGVADPTEKLEVAGNIKVSDRVSSKSVTSETGIFSQDISIGGDIEVVNNAVVSGNLGIGVPEPIEKLEVAGNVLVTDKISSTEMSAVDGSFTNQLQIGNLLRIDGHVGVGIDTPVEKLDVAGNIKASDKIISTDIEAVNGAFSDRVTVVNDVTLGGNLGVGTEAPTEKLEVLGNAIISETLTTKNLNAVEMALSGDFNVAGNSSVAQNAFVGGQMGIGVETPSEKLEVAGNIKALGKLTGTGVEASNGTFADQVSVNNLLSVAGQVAIGTTDPKGYKLAVAGEMAVAEITVEVEVNWPDYVFKKNYELQPLSEIKSFVEQNHHLPEVPSAKEITNNGMKMGEMNMILLKKIEELTLHLIEKDLQLQQVMERLSKLENK